MGANIHVRDFECKKQCNTSNKRKLTNLISSTILAHLEKLSLNVFVKSMEEFYMSEANESSSNQPLQNSGSSTVTEPYDQKAFWLLEYQSVISQFTKYIGLYFLVFVVYVCVQALLFFTLLLFSKSIDDIMRVFLLGFAGICCLLFYFCIVVATTVVQKLGNRKEKALSKFGLSKFGLKKNVVDDEFSIGDATSVVYFIFNTVILFMIILLIFCPDNFIL